MKTVVFSTVELWRKTDPWLSGTRWSYIDETTAINLNYCEHDVGNNNGLVTGIRSLQLTRPPTTVIDVLARVQRDANSFYCCVVNV